MKVLIIDNFDSFTYNLYHYVNEFVDDCIVVRSDMIHTVDVNTFSKIIFSPGPSLPISHSIFSIILDKYSRSKSILGICLGHQAIIEYFGGRLKNLEFVKHGVSSRNIIVNTDEIFDTVPNKFQVAHYHSWVADETYFPDCLTITSQNENDLIMSFKHNSLDIKGVQFHPESVLTLEGKRIIQNWLLS